MARTESTMLTLGTKAPAFTLPNTNGETVSLADYSHSKGVVVMFICNHCPYVHHVREELSRMGRDYQNSDIAIIAINSNDVDKYPDDHPDRMRDEVENFDYVFPYLYDETQDVAKAYGAACTPDFFVFDAEQSLTYRGQLDGSRPGNDVAVTGTDLRAAIDAVLVGKEPEREQKPSLGCNIKWREGNEPEYFAKP
ncbi:MAG: thioredoxin family protein [Myxococcales bacterium]|nr:thioredoxin family protein [Myxococcales bacterium]|tara:strand:+ start:59 stop:643 length:585 start_codon:yes stop_codon:yes gene_type:complete